MCFYTFVLLKINHNVVNYLFLPDLSELPLCEVSLACDNLLCDGHGRPPNPMLMIDVYMPSVKLWVTYGHTEVIEVPVHPHFLL